MTPLLADIAAYTINGIAQGSVYALIALGYTMVYGIIKLINFAHGEFFMIGGFLGLFCLNADIPLPVTFAVAALGAGSLAVAVEALAYKPLRHAGRIPPLVTAIGVSLFFQYGGQLLLGAAPRGFPRVLEASGIAFGEVRVTGIQLVIIGATLVLMLFLWWLVAATRLGKAMRATSFNRDAAELMGINTNRVIAFTFFLGAGFAGVAGILVGMYYNTVDPMMGMLPGIKAFVAAVLGGIGVIPGAVLGGLLLGVVENLVTGLWIATYRDAIALGILILVLLFRPAGILGNMEREKI